MVSVGWCFFISKQNKKKKKKRKRRGQAPVFGKERKRRRISSEQGGGVLNTPTPTPHTRKRGRELGGVPSRRRTAGRHQSYTGVAPSSARGEQEEKGRGVVFDPAMCCPHTHAGKGARRRRWGGAGNRRRTPSRPPPQSRANSSQRERGRP